MFYITSVIPAETGTLYYVLNAPLVQHPPGID